MKQPKYTDLRYPHGYVRAANTDVSKTFRRVRERLKVEAEQKERDAAEAEAKVRTMKGIYILHSRIDY